MAHMETPQDVLRATKEKAGLSGTVLGGGRVVCVPATLTAGQATSRKGRYHNVAKTILLGDLANGLETRKVIVAHNLPLRDRFMAELESFEVKTTAAGNTVLDARATEHHADLARSLVGRPSSHRRRGRGAPRAVLRTMPAQEGSPFALRHRWPA